MQTRSSALIAAISVGLLFFAVCAFANATYTYKKGEYVTVDKSTSFKIVDMSRFL